MGAIGEVIFAINQRGHRQLQIRGAELKMLEAFDLRRRLPDDLKHLAAAVRGYEQDGVRMRLPDIDHQKLDAVLILPVKLFEYHDPGAKWRASIATEEEDDGLLTQIAGEADLA